MILNTEAAALWSRSYGPVCSGLYSEEHKIQTEKEYAEYQPIIILIILYYINYINSMKGYNSNRNRNVLFL